eukprot:8540352-Prorocentrum_lima.AAC.1
MRLRCMPLGSLKSNANSSNTSFGLSQCLEGTASGHPQTTKLRVASTGEGVFRSAEGVAGFLATGPGVSGEAEA